MHGILPGLKPLPTSPNPSVGARSREKPVSQGLKPRSIFGGVCVTSKLVPCYKTFVNAWQVAHSPIQPPA